MPLTKAQLNEWCDTLESHPERQHCGSLVDPTGTKFCCLGQLAVLNGAEIVPTKRNVDQNELKFKSWKDGVYCESLLDGDIENKFGSNDGSFNELDMPDLSYDGKTYPTAADANDDGVPWGVIAKHFRKYYKTSD